MMHTERKGELFVLSAAVMWSLFPILTILSLSTFGPLFSLALTAFFSLFLIVPLATYRHRWHEFRNIAGLKDALLAAFFTGFLFYVFFFFGLKFTTAGNAILISMLEVFTTFLFFNVVRKEYISRRQILGAVLMVIGAVIVVLPAVLESFSLNKGDVLIMIGVMVAPFGNFFQQRARKVISSETIMLVRGLLTPLPVLLLAIFFGETIDFGGLGQPLVYIILSGVFLFGLSKIFWLEGIYRISVTKAIALNGIIPLFTLFFAFLILKETPTVFQLFSFIPLFAGLLLLTRNQAISKIT